MIFTKVYDQFFLTICAVMYSFQYKVQEWIRQEIVDDDPNEQEMFFPKNKRV